jgi:predicted aspartyl protease
MGRIVTAVRVENPMDPTKHIVCDALVDTGASNLVLPGAWKDRLGALASTQEVEMETATQDTVKAEICGPVRIHIEGFRAIHGEVLFIDMHPENGTYEPLLGYIPLEQSQAAVDRLGHRLIPVKHLDLK